MEPFLSLFYTFLTQLLQSNPTTYDDDGSGMSSHDPSPAPSVPGWLKLDLRPDQVLAYFPSTHRRSIKSASSSSDSYERGGKEMEAIPLSRLLSLFKSYVKRNEAGAGERKMLAGRAKLVESLTARNTQLEEDVWRLRKVSTTQCIYIT